VKLAVPGKRLSRLVEIRPEARNAEAENSGEIVREDRQASVTDEVERVLRCPICRVRRGRPMPAPHTTTTRCMLMKPSLDV
jgi:hypothetical protein